MTNLRVTKSRNMHNLQVTRLRNRWSYIQRRMKISEPSSYSYFNYFYDLETTKPSLCRG